MSSRYVTRQAEPADSRAILDLFADTPQEGMVALTFEREPDYFRAADVTAKTRDIWLVEDTEEDRIAGIVQFGARDVFVDGEVRTLPYASDLRIGQAYQGGRTLFRLGKILRERIGEGFMQTVVLEDNVASMETITKGRTSIPPYHPAGRHRTRIIDLRRRHRAPERYAVRSAVPDDLPAIQRFWDTEAPEKQFAPAYDFSKIGTDDPYWRGVRLEDIFLVHDGDALVGMAGLWDQKGFKQTRIGHIAMAIGAVRPLYNLWVRAVGGLTVPTEGGLIDYAYLHAACVKGNDPAIFDDLLRAVRQAARARGFAALVAGFAENDPLHGVLDGYRGQALTSRHFLIAIGDHPHEKIDGDRLVYLETARL